MSHGYLRFLRKVTSVIGLLQNISDYLVQRNSLTFCNFPLGQRKPRIVGEQMNKNDITRSGREKVRTCMMLSSCWIYNQPPILSQQTIVLMKTSSRRLQDVLIKTNMFALALRLQKTSWSRPIYLSWPYVFKTSSRRFQEVFKTSSRHLAKMSSRRIIKLKCSW